MNTHPVNLSAAAANAGFDRRMMRAAISFGRRNLGLTAPNPSVGALVVRDGVIVGRGVTSRSGRPHAETIAIDEAGEKARGATLYVSLEPCSHYGRTPPCADAIIKAGITRVVSALDDPDPRVAGRGHRMLLDAGIAVERLVCDEEARLANLGHILRVSGNRPMVTLKLAETADGYASGDRHDPRLYITGQAANNLTQIWRSQADAIMAGIDTVIADDPLLTVRLPGLEKRKPLRVVLDSKLRLPLQSRLVQTAADFPLIVICGVDAPREAAAQLAQAGVECIRVACGAEGRIDLAAALGALAARGVTRVFSEGGPRIAAQLIAAGLADETIVFTSPKPLGRGGTRSLESSARELLADPARFTLSTDTRSGNDRLRIWRKA